MTTLLLLLATAEGESREPEEEPFPANEHVWRFVPIPLITANVDEGLGGGLVLAFHHHHGGVRPFRDDLSLKVYLTTAWLQRYELRWEGIEVFDLPLRTFVRLGLFSTVTQPYCGVGNGVSCDPARAEDAAAARGLEPGTDAFEEAARHYYLTRFVRPSLDLQTRWRVVDEPVRIEALGGWRGAYTLAGDFLERGPWPHSLYAGVYPHGEDGLSSVLQVGVTADDRDSEVWPTRGFFLVASTRTASPWWGSHWDFQGLHGSLAGYVLLHRAPDVVLANRALVDLLFGEPPTDELGSIAGIRDAVSFGGQWVGRGMRAHRYIGAIKLIDQIEVRTALFHIVEPFFDTRIDLATTVFLDAAWIGADWQDFDGGLPGTDLDAGSPQRILFGAGVGLVLLFDRAFNVRLDVAGSPFEQSFPSFYAPVKYPW